jgi:hypothetical protein
MATNPTLRNAMSEDVLEEILDMKSYRKASGLFQIWIQRIREEYERELVVGLSAFSVGVILGIVLGRSTKD